MCSFHHDGKKFQHKEIKNRWYKCKKKRTDERREAGKTLEDKSNYHKVSFSFKKFCTEQTVDSICQPQRLETNKTICFMWPSFWREVHRLRWKFIFKIVDESHTNKKFQRAAKMLLSLLPTTKTTQKPPRERLTSNDQMDTFRKRDTITSLADLNKTTATILESIKADSDLLVQLQYNGIPVPLPRFVQGHNAPLKKLAC